MPHWFGSVAISPRKFCSYKGDNRLVYFDINDFDEAALAPPVGLGSHAHQPIGLALTVRVSSRRGTNALHDFPGYLCFGANLGQSLLGRA